MRETCVFFFLLASTCTILLPLVAYERCFPYLLTLIWFFCFFLSYLLTLIVIVVFTGDTRYFILAVHGLCEGFVLPMLGPFLRVFSGLGIAACTAPLWRTRRPRSRRISMMSICRPLRG